ncbi:MAG: YfhO family protein [candidate division WOR-3 bacterium]
MAKKHHPQKVTPPGKTPAGGADRNRSGPVPENRLHRYAVALLFILPLVFFGRFLFGTVMMFGTDFIGGGGYAAHQFMAEYIRKHLTVAFWQPQILSGQPTVAAFFGDLFYPTMLLRLLLPVHVVWAWTFFLQTFIAGLGTYLFLRELKLHTLAAFLAGVAYMFSGSLLTLALAGHDGRLIGSSLMPLALFFITRGINRRQLIWFALTGMTLGLQLLSGHIQKVYYTGLILLAWFIFCFIRTLRQEKNTGLGVRLAGYFVLAMLFAFGLAAVQYLPIYGNLPYGARGAERGYEFATSWSMPIAEIFDLLTPRFSGGLENYWSRNPFKLHSEYLGILPLLFALLGLIRTWGKPRTRFFFFAFIIALLMAWGGNTPFYRLPYYLLPGLSKFRGPGMIFFLAGFSICVLAGFGIDRLLDRQHSAERKKDLRLLIYAAAALLLLLLFFLAGRNAATALLNPGARLPQFEANYPALLTGLVLALLIWLIGTGLVVLVTRNRLQPQLFTLLTALVMTMDTGIALRLWDNSRGYIRAMPPPQEYFTPDEVVRFLSRDSSYFRVLPLNYERSDEGELWLHNIHSTGGQMPNPLQSYQDFIGAGKSVMFQANNLLNPNFMNLLNVKYVITLNLPEDLSRYDAQTRQIISQLKTYFSQPWFQPVFTGARYAIYQNLRCLPRAFIVFNYQLVNSREELLARLMDSAFDPAHTALLYADPGLPPVTAPDTTARCTITFYDPNIIRLQAQLSQPGLLILSENYHPDWQVRVDGNPATLLPAFHTLRAIPLSPGTHQLELTHIPRYFRLGLILTLISIMLLIAISAISLIPHRKKATPSSG